MTGSRKLALGLAGLLLLLGLGRILPLSAWLQALVLWLGRSGLWGAVAFGTLYAVVAGLGFPALPLTLAAGVVYGPWWGTLLVSPASTAGAALAFLLGRGLLRDWVKERARRNPSLAALDSAVAAEGWRLVALLRLSPLFPFNLLNLSLGATRLPLGPYVVASWVAMLPGTFLYVSLGAATGKATGLSRSGGADPWMLGLGIAATLVLTWRVAVLARQALRTRLPQTEQP